MADNKVQEVQVQHVEVDALERARGFWERFKKPIIAVAGAIIIIAGGWLVYKKNV